MKIAVNGLGRMGRLFVRAALARGLDVVCANEPRGTPAAIALGIEFDSVQGRFDREVLSVDDAILIDGHRIELTKSVEPR